MLAVEILVEEALEAIGEFMNPATFLSRLDHGKISAAIAESERKTSGEIRVFISRHKVEDPRSSAEDQFVKLGMSKTKHRNGVLLFFAPLSQKFAMIGDQAIHEKCGQHHWRKLVDEMQGHLKRDQFTDAIVHGINAAGALLETHFPADGGGGNELSNDVAED